MNVRRLRKTIDNTKREIDLVQAKLYRVRTITYNTPELRDELLAEAGTQVIDYHAKTVELSNELFKLKALLTQANETIIDTPYGAMSVNSAIFKLNQSAAIESQMRDLSTVRESKRINTLGQQETTVLTYDPTHFENLSVYYRTMKEDLQEAVDKFNMNHEVTL